MTNTSEKVQTTTLSVPSQDEHPRPPIHPAYLQNVMVASLPNNPLSVAFLTHSASLSTLAAPSRNACDNGLCSTVATASRRPLSSPWLVTLHAHVAPNRQVRHETRTCTHVIKQADGTVGQFHTLDFWYCHRGDPWGPPGIHVHDHGSPR